MDPLAPIRTTRNPKYPNRTEPIPEMPRPRHINRNPNPNPNRKPNRSSKNSNIFRIQPVRIPVSDWLYPIPEPIIRSTRILLTLNLHLSFPFIFMSSLFSAYMISTYLNLFYDRLHVWITILCDFDLCLITSRICDLFSFCSLHRHELKH